MGDRFYMQQKNHKPGRRLKKDYIEQFEEILGFKVDGLDRLTIATIEDLTSKLCIKLTSVKFKRTLQRLAKS